MWRPLLFGIACWVGLSTGASAAEFHGQLDPVVEPGTRVMAAVTPASAELSARLPTPPPTGAILLMPRQPVGIKGVNYRVILVVAPDGTKTLWLDRDQDGRFSLAEAWSFPHDGRTVKLTVPWNNGRYREFPLEVEWTDEALPRRAATDAGPPPGGVTALIYNFNIVFGGRVPVDDHSIRLEFYPLPAAVTIDPAETRTGLDANGNGRIENELGEMDTGRGRVPVFRVGDRYLAVRVADVATGELVLAERSAAEYTRFAALPGQEMPDFEFEDFAGVRHRLKEYRGRFVLLDFWGTWCGPCIEEMRKMDPLYAQYHDRGFEIIGMNMERTAGKLTPAEYAALNERARTFIAKAGHRWPQAAQESIERVAFDVLHVNSYPTCILLGPEGKVISRDARGETLANLLQQGLP